MKATDRCADPAPHFKPRLLPFPPELELVLARIRSLALLRAQWLRKLWAEERAVGATPAEIETILLDGDSPEAEAEWRDSEPQWEPLKARLADIEARLEAASASRLAQFAQMFGLEPAERDLFQACLAVALDPALGRVCADLQDHAGRNYVTEELAARLFGYGRQGPWNAESALFRWEILTEKEVAPGEPRMLLCDPQIRDWLLGRDGLDRSLVGVARLHPPLPPLTPWPVQEAAHFLQQTLSGAGEARVRLTLTGPPGSGRRTLAAVIAHQLGLPLLTIQAEEIEDADWRRVFLRAQRQAYLDRCALAWVGESAFRRPWPQVAPHFPLQFLIAEPGQSAPPVEGMIEHTISLPALPSAERYRLWKAYLPAAQTWPEAPLRALAERYRVTVGDIARVAQKEASDAEEASRRVRETMRGRLGDLAQLLECPFDWEDLVIAAPVRGTLEDFAFEASARGAFWEEARTRRLFPQGRGLLALFSGLPGTGKTMAAQVIAARLGMDLYRIDLSTVVSKYVGETSQNLERLLQRAAAMDVVLLFDEADALYGRRTQEVRDAQDRFANMDTSHLMVAIERYEGVVLLATNLKNNIDPAFLRRIRYIVEFPKPDAAQRREIWRRVVGGLTDSETLAKIGADVDYLAEQIEMTGAQIKYSVLAALFVARRAGEGLALPHLLRGLNRELGKEGRALNEREQERILRHG